MLAGQAHAEPVPITHNDLITNVNVSTNFRYKIVRHETHC